jgi:hypothetical protein
MIAFFSREMVGSPPASRKIFRTFPMRAREDSRAGLFDICPRATHLPQDAEKQCSTITRYIQKVACIKDALNNLGDDCKAATASVVTAKQ